MTTRLLLVRHGETVWHAENRYCGSSDVDLTARGEQQAEELAAWTLRRRPDAIACSPLRRARMTAAPAARALETRPKVVEELRELDFGWGEGRTLAEMEAEDPAAVAAFREDPVAGAFPGAEPPGDAAARAGQALRRIAADPSVGTVLVVAHNSLLRLTLCSLLGIPLSRYRAVLPRLGNAAVTEIELTAGSAPAALHSLNVPTDAAPGHSAGPANG